MSSIRVLTYHAVYGDQYELEQLPAEDRHYAVLLDRFEAQLGAMLAASITVLRPIVLMDPSGADKKADGVLLTFDDGDRSFYRHISPALTRRGLRAIFFVTTDFIGRPGYCTWPQLAEMAAKGHWIQPHGKTHRFLYGLTEEESRAELALSKGMIEDRLGRPVTAISFPGGRYSAREVELGRQLGYRLFFTSRPGRFLLGDGLAGSLVRRLTVRSATPLETVIGLARGDTALLAVRQGAYAAKALAQRVLGDRLYYYLSLVKAGLSRGERGR